MLKRHPSPILLANLRTAIILAREEIQEIRTKACQWCESINTHTSLHELWTMLNIASGKYKTQPRHPQAQDVAEDLIHSLKTRGDTNILTCLTINRLDTLRPERFRFITEAINTAAETLTLHHT